jgi:hypothetical protein
MNRRRLLPVFLIIVTIGIWVFVFIISRSLLYKPSPTACVKSSPGISVKSLEIFADSALAQKPTTQSFTYLGQFDAPFKTVEEAFTSPPRPTKLPPANSEVSLLLKGVLLKQQPLAILEDAEKKTYICGINETVLGQTVTAISATSISLKNSRGTYSLTVKE